jgi:hypothetical protein
LSEGGTARGRTPRSDRAVRIYVEAGITMAVTDDPPQFVRFTFGQERIAPDDSEETVARYERIAYEACEAVVERRVRRLARLIRRVQSEESEPAPPPARSRRGRQ